MCSVLLWPFKTILTQSMELGRETPFSSHVILAALSHIVSHSFLQPSGGFQIIFCPNLSGSI